MLRAILITVSLLVSALPLLAQQSAEEKENALLVEELPKLDWKIEGTHKLKSHSTISIPDDHMLVLGKDAEKFFILNGNPSGGKAIEAAFLTDDGDIITFESLKDGYVKLDDWEKVDPQQMINELSKNTEEENKVRRRQGISEIHVLGWLQEPILNRKTNTVFWAIKGWDDDGRKIFNSVALKLGRHGYERICWLSDRGSYSHCGGELNRALKAHSFDRGHRYEDHAKGDKIASYGIATLVAATIGGKVAKAGGLILLLKKFGGFIAAGAGALLIKFRSLFSRNKSKRKK